MAGVCNPKNDWRVEDDANTLIRAEEIKLDKVRCEKAMKVVTTKQKASAQARLDAVKAVGEHEASDYARGA
jgi:hypothetical protein